MPATDMTIAFRLIRAVGLLLAGLVGFVTSFRRLGTPAQAVEGSGWLDQQYGADGVV